MRGKDPMTAPSSLVNSADNRVPWVDTAKGICILLVVMMHSTLGVEAVSGQQGWLGDVVAFARPFRMPDFFLVSALFLSARIDADWRLYLDRKVLHFVYFYLLWVAIQMGFKFFSLYDGDLADYTLTRTASNLVTIAGPDGTDSLIDVEYFRFADQDVNIWSLAII